MGFAPAHNGFDYGLQGGVSSLGPLTAAGRATMLAGVNYASSAYPSASRVIYTPLMLPAPVTIHGGWTYNGATAAGNWNVGIYEWESKARLLETGTVAQAGTSVVQRSDLSGGGTVDLKAGLYIMAIISSSATATFFRVTNSNYLLAGHGCCQEAGSGSTLPSTASLATAVTSAYFPAFGFEVRADNIV